jgi:hypothetical protein
MRIPIIIAVLCAFALAGTALGQCPGHKTSQAKAYLEDKACPANKAAELGAKPFDDFHKVMAPVWHKDYPEKNIDALIAAAPVFKEQYAAIETLDPKLTNEHKLAYFNQCREEFGKVLNQFAEAAEKGDTEQVYELMPAVHNSFEQTAAALLPIEYKEFDAFRITLGLITDTHLPEDNMEGIVGSTATLANKAENLTVESLPQDLSWSKEEVTPVLERIRELAAEMKKCCDANDMEAYKKHAEALKAEAESFSQKYL